MWSNRAVAGSIDRPATVRERRPATGSCGGRRKASGRDVRHAGGSGWPARRTPDRQYAYESAPLGEGRKRGALVQAIGINRGGRNSKLHALSSGEGRPLRLPLTGGDVADCRAADVLIGDLAPRTIVLADKAYDSNAISDPIDRQSAAPNIPSKANRRLKSCRSPTPYRGKDYRRIATRCDRLATNFPRAICLVAAVTRWLCTPILSWIASV